MTNAQARRIGELVRELGDLMRSVSAVPTAEQSRIIRSECSAKDASAALNMVVCITAETAGNGLDPLTLADAIESLAGVLGVMHRESQKREVRSSEVLRLLATHFEGREKTSSAVDRLIALISNTAPSSDSGSN
jgi:hypothetical protein